jgi:hypothetical protein
MEAKQLLSVNNRFRTESNKEVFDILFDEFIAFNDPYVEELTITEFNENQNVIYDQIFESLIATKEQKIPSAEKSYIRKLIHYTNYRKKYLTNE